LQTVLEETETVFSYDGTQHDLEKGEPIELAEGVSI
jgi:hypothetical protein